MAGADPSRMSFSSGPEEVREDRAAAEPDKNHAMLESVIRQTLNAWQPDHPIDTEQRRALEAIVARHRGQPLAFEPMVVDLVREMVVPALLARKAERLQTEVCREVARFLWEDPQARSRLQSLWVALGEGEP